jgi:diguanylate cyclase (GGDEF)-like protein
MDEINVTGALSDTQWTETKEPAGAANEAYLVHIYPSSPTMGSRFQLSNRSQVIGRGDDSDILIADNSVSRSHARIEPGPDGFMVIDLNSTNGTFVNDVSVSTARINDGDYVRVGNCICRFLAGDNVEAAYHEEIYRLTIYDALTGIHNKRYLLDFVERELIRSARHGRPLAFVMFDIDNFKSINDQLQHLGGDFTLRELADCIRNNVRSGDLLARYGGEEFALVLPETTLEGAVDVSEQIRTTVAAHQFHFEEQSYQLTISMGVAATLGEATVDPHEFMRLADNQLYRAKEMGRNRVAFSAR